MLQMTSKAFQSSWPLFFGLFMIMVGNGLQGTLLGVRASIEDFPKWMTGLIMSTYFLGYLLGTILVPKFLKNVGHIRVFAALASLASITVLFHGIFVHPLSWLPVRLITGFSFCGLYIVVESWLNDAATNKNRGMMMSIYLVVNYTGVMIGQLLLNLADPSEIELFITVSVLVSLALIPVSLSTRPAPDFEKIKTLKLKKLLKVSPLGVVGVFQNGLSGAAIFTILPVYASVEGASIPQISIIMTLYILGSMMLIIPIGWLSDNFDRRRVIIFNTMAGIVLCSGMYMVGNIDALLFLGLLMLFGGVNASMYGLTVSHANDHVNDDEIVAVSSSMLLANGIGACFGPILLTLAMEFFGQDSFFLFIVVTYIALLGFGIYRTFAAKPVPMNDQGDYVPISMRNTAYIMQMVEDEAIQVNKVQDSKKS